MVLMKYSNVILYFKYVTASAKIRLVHTTSIYFLFSHIIYSAQGMDHQSVVSSFGIIALDGRKSKDIDLYSDYTENKLQTLTFTAITSISISLQCWNLA